MKTRVQPVADGLPALAAEAWAALDGEPEALELERRALLAWAESLDHDIQIASAWDDQGRLLGVSTGFRNESFGAGRAMRTLGHQATLDDGTLARGLHVRRESDAVAVVRALVGAWAAHTREAGLDRMLLSLCPPEQPVLRQVAEELGARALPTTGDNRIALERAASCEEFLATIKSKHRYDFRIDLARPGKAGARLVETAPTPALMARLVPFYDDQMERVGVKQRLAGRGHPLELIARRIPAEQLRVLLCERDERLLGYLLSYRAGAVSHLMHSGHVTGDSLQIYLSLIAERLRRDLDTGATTILIGYTGDEYKRRLGARLGPRVHYYFSLARAA